MIGGAIVSIIVGAVGAILDYAVVESPYQHGFNLNTVGVILMIVGAVGLVLSLLYGLMVGSWGYRRHRTVIQDANGQVVRREDSYI
jgi:uncharacterized membrane protein YeaQ/YmgE (transglycosylase-associated protein family)